MNLPIQKRAGRENACGSGKTNTSGGSYPGHRFTRLLDIIDRILEHSQIVLCKKYLANRISI